MKKNLREKAVKWGYALNHSTYTKYKKQENLMKTIYINGWQRQGKGRNEEW